MSASVEREQRFTRSRPCPICGGFDSAPRGRETRCFGFLSEDGKWAHCTREEHAGGLDQDSSSCTFAHRLTGECKCGASHGAAAPSSPSAGTPGCRGIVAATYRYCDEDGRLLLEAVRFLPKRFLQRRPDGTGGWAWDVKGVRRVLYRLPELIAADPAEPVFIVEGEKDVESVRALGLVATCNPMGALKWHSVARDAANVLRGRQVVIIPDADFEGKAHAAQVARALRGAAGSVRMLELPGAGKDATDWIAGGGTREELLHLAMSAPAPAPEPRSRP